MPLNDYFVRFKTYDPTDPRLGRHVKHDSRSIEFFRAPEADSFATLASIQHHSFIPTLDQLHLGSCTGNAGTKALSYEPFWSSAGVQVLSTTDEEADEEYAIGVYSDATKVDSARGTYPPTDTGSDGLAIGKVFVARKKISGYQHATSLLAALTALQDKAIITGTEFRGDMFNPGPDGRLKITGNVEGGHEYVLDEVDVEQRRVWMQNSWNTDWGIDGRAWFTWDDYEELLHADGDATVFVPVSAPAPTPTPGPVPTPAPSDAQAQFVAQAQHWVDLRHTAKSNVLFEQQVQTYLDWLAQA